MVLETLNSKRDDLMNKGKKLQNVGQWQQETVSSEHSFLPFCALIASMSLFEWVSVSQKCPACMPGTTGLPSLCLTPEPKEGKKNSKTQITSF